MKRIFIPVALCLALAAPLFADDAPAPAAAPAAAPTTKPTPAAAAKKEAKPPQDKCLVSVSQETFDTDKACAVHDVSQCGKNMKTCQWKGPERKCRGYLLQMCLSNVHHRCDGGVEAVTSFPAKREPHTARFKCHEKTPLSVKKI